MPVEALYRLAQILPSHRPWSGDKAFYLGFLAQQGIPIVPGIVFPADRLQDYLKQMPWIEALLEDLPQGDRSGNLGQSRQLQAIAQQIRTAIQTTPLPDTWLTDLENATQGWQSLLLRPSLVLATDPALSSRTTGLLESKTCWNHRAAIGQAIQQVWAELFRAKSLLYWQRIGIPMQQVHLAVLVQPLQSAIATGEIYSTDAGMEVQAVWGLGEALVKGEVAPDRYEIKKNGYVHHPAWQTHAYYPSESLEHPVQKTLLEPVQQTQSPLNSEQIQSLVDLTRQATSHLGVAPKMEWILAPGMEHEPALWITQVIPQPEKTQAALLTGLAAAPGKAIAPAWVAEDEGGDVPSGVILVTTNLPPDLLLRSKQVGGIVTEQGGMTSHAAILAREMGIPAVLGVVGATRLIQSGERLQVDGDRGEVQKVSRATVLSPASPVPVRSFTPSNTQLLVTLSQPESIAHASQLPVAGVGLLRSELMLLNALERQHPKMWLEQGRQSELVDRIAENIRPFAEAFAPRPVFYRSLDLRSHEFATLEGMPAEASPMLGVRGTFSYQKNPAQFEIELLALRQIQAWGYSQVHLLLPFVRTVEEFIFCRQMVEQVGLTQNPDFQLWIMAEVPSVLLLLADYVAAGVQGIAIGSNDLTQLLLGVDRENAEMAIAFNPQHSVVMKAVQQLITEARQLEIACHLCGQVNPEQVGQLVAWGITGISVDMGEVERMREAIG
jgi:pyruvate, water dikinase